MREISSPHMPWCSLVGDIDSRWRSVGGQVQRRDGGASYRQHFNDAVYYTLDFQTHALFISSLHTQGFLFISSYYFAQRARCVPLLLQ